MQSKTAPVAPVPSPQPPLVAAVIPVRFTEAAVLALSVSRAAAPVGRMEASGANPEALLIAARPGRHQAVWEEGGWSSVGSPLSDWPL